MNLVLRYLGKMEEKRGDKQQHQKNQDDHNYTAKLWNRICNNYLKYILIQWIVHVFRAVFDFSNSRYPSLFFVMDLHVVLTPMKSWTLIGREGINFVTCLKYSILIGSVMT